MCNICSLFCIPGDSPVLPALKELIERRLLGFHGLHDDTMALRRAVGPPFTAKRQQDAHDFLGHLLQIVQPLQQLFAFTHKKRVATCTVCNTKHLVPDVRFHMCKLIVSLCDCYKSVPIHAQDEQFELVLRTTNDGDQDDLKTRLKTALRPTTEGVDIACDFCGCNRPHTVVGVVEFGAEQRYLLVVIGLFELKGGLCCFLSF